MITGRGVRVGELSSVEQAGGSLEAQAHPVSKQEERFRLAFTHVVCQAGQDSQQPSGLGLPHAGITGMRHQVQLETRFRRAGM